MGAEQGHDHDGAPDAQRYSVSLCAGGCVHGVRCVPLLAAGADRSEPLPHVDGMGGQRWQGGGPVVGNDEAGYSWTTYPERLQSGGDSLEDLQDLGAGSGLAGESGASPDPYIGNYGDNSLLYFHQYQKAMPGSPAGGGREDRNADRQAADAV